MLKKFIVLYTLAMVMSACSTADVTGDVNDTRRDYGDTRFTNSGSGTQTINVTLSGESATDRTGTVSTANNPENTVSPKLAVGLEGGTGTAGDEAFIEGVTSLSNRLLDNSKKDSDNPITNPIPEVVPAVIPVVVPTETKPNIEVPEEIVTEPVTSIKYETRFHHTTTGSSDGGKSLVMCPGQVMDFDRCVADGVSIPYHGTDDGREIYWNMSFEPKGTIICTKDGNGYYYKADSTFVTGDCSAESKSEVTEEYNSSETQTTKFDHDKQFAWLDKTGTDYGGKIKFVWEGVGCFDYVVPDAGKTTSRDGTSQQAQAYYFVATDPEHNKMQGRASIYSDPSCMTDKVTLYYNK